MQGSAPDVYKETGTKCYVGVNIHGEAGPKIFTDNGAMTYDGIEQKICTETGESI